MRRLIFSISIVYIFTVFIGNSDVNAQSSDVLDGIYEKEHVPARKPIPYHHLREADMMWTKKIWRILNLKEKINHPLYYPKETPIGDRMSLIDLLLWGVNNQGLTAYDEADGDEFATVMTISDIEERFDAKADTNWVEDIETGELTPVPIEGEIYSREVKYFLVKELWFFDKQRSVMDVRIIGLCPIREYSKNEDADIEGSGTEQMSKVKLFWIYFPEARKILASHEVFNPYNDAERMSFDDLFFKRFFSSYIVQESNSYNNRAISEYTIGLESLLEAERIKESIFNFEQDLWVY